MVGKAQPVRARTNLDKYDEVPSIEQRKQS